MPTMPKRLRSNASSAHSSSKRCKRLPTPDNPRESIISAEIIAQRIATNDKEEDQEQQPDVKQEDREEGVYELPKTPVRLKVPLPPLPEPSSLNAPRFACQGPRPLKSIPCRCMRNAKATAVFDALTTISPSIDPDEDLADNLKSLKIQEPSFKSKDKARAPRPGAIARLSTTPKRRTSGSGSRAERKEKRKMWFRSLMEVELDVGRG